MCFLPFSDKLFLYFLKYLRSVNCFRPFALQISRPAGSLCFHSFSRCDWFVSASHDFDENKQLHHECTINFPLIDRLFHSYLIKAIDHSFYGFTGAINHLKCWENTRKAWKSLAWRLVIYKLFSCSPNISWLAKPSSRPVVTTRGCMSVTDWSAVTVIPVKPWTPEKISGMFIVLRPIRSEMNRRR